LLASLSKGRRLLRSANTPQKGSLVLEPHSGS